MIFPSDFVLKIHSAMLSVISILSMNKVYIIRIKEYQCGNNYGNKYGFFHHDLLNEPSQATEFPSIVKPQTVVYKPQTVC